MFSGKFLSGIFGGGDVIKEGFALIDSIHTSKEEEIAVKAVAKVDTLKAYAPFKVAQRYLALMFASVFLLSFALVLGLTLAGLPTNDVHKVLGAFYIGEIMLAIVGFYFGGGFMESARKSQK